MLALGTMTYEEFWRGLLVDENWHQRRSEITFVIRGITSVRGYDAVSVTGGNIWEIDKPSGPIELVYDGKNILPLEVRRLFENGNIVRLVFDLERRIIHILINWEHHHTTETFSL